MKLGTLLAIAAVIAFIFGLAFILMPAQTMSMYAITLEAAGQWIGRYLGSAFLGIAVLNWFARKAPDGGALRAIVVGDFVLTLTGLIVAVLNGAYGSGNALVWSTVAIYLFLALGFGYFQFAKPAAS